MTGRGECDPKSQGERFYVLSHQAPDVTGTSTIDISKDVVAGSNTQHIFFTVNPLHLLLH